MTIVNRPVIEKFISQHASSKASLTSWLEEAVEADWKTSQDIRNRYRSADFLPGNRVTFTMGENIHQLVVLVRYHSGILFIEKIGLVADDS